MHPLLLPACPHAIFSPFFAVLAPAKFQADVYVRAHVHVRKRERVLFLSDVEKDLTLKC